MTDIPAPDNIDGPLNERPHNSLTIRLDELGPDAPNPFRGFRRVLVAASGSQPQLLAAAPTDLNWHLGLGAAIILTGVMAAIAMTTAIVTATGVSPIFAFMFGLFWGTLIFNMDRWFVTTQRSDQNMRTRLSSLLLRLTLAFVIGYVVSEAMVLTIFSKEIGRQVAELSIERQDKALKEIDKGTLTSAIKRATGELNKTKKQIDTVRSDRDGAASKVAKPDPKLYADPALQQLEKRKAELQQEISGYEKRTEEVTLAFQEKQQAVVEEAAVGDPKVGRPGGCKEVCRQKEIAAAGAKTTMNRVIADLKPKLMTANEELEKITTSFSEKKNTSPEYEAALGSWDTQVEQYSDARNIELGKLTESLPTLERAVTDADATAREARKKIQTSPQDGLLIRLEALDREAQQNGRALVLRWLLSLLFIFVEILPVLGKFLYSLGTTKRPYEQLVESIGVLTNETTDSVREQAQLDRQFVFHSLREQSRLQDRADRASQQHFLERSVGLYKALGDRRLDEWARDNGLDPKTAPFRLDDFHARSFEPDDPIQPSQPNAPSGGGRTGPGSDRNPLPNPGAPTAAGTAESAEQRTQPEQQGAPRGAGNGSPEGRGKNENSNQVKDFINKMWPGHGDTGPDNPGGGGHVNTGTIEDAQ